MVTTLTKNAVMVHQNSKIYFFKEVFTILATTVNYGLCSKKIRVAYFVISK